MLSQKETAVQESELPASKLGTNGQEGKEPGSLVNPLTEPIEELLARVRKSHQRTKTLEKEIHIAKQRYDSSKYETAKLLGEAIRANKSLPEPLTDTKVYKHCGMSRPTARQYLDLFEICGDDAELGTRMSLATAGAAGKQNRANPHFADEIRERLQEKPEMTPKEVDELALELAKEQGVQTPPMQTRLKNAGINDPLAAVVRILPPERRNFNGLPAIEVSPSVASIQARLAMFNSSEFLSAIKEYGINEPFIILVSPRKEVANE